MSPSVKGRAAIEQYYTKLFAGGTKVGQFALTHLESRAVGDTGYDVGTYHQSMNPPGRPERSPVQQEESPYLAQHVEESPELGGPSRFLTVLEVLQDVNQQQHGVESKRPSRGD